MGLDQLKDIHYYELPFRFAFGKTELVIVLSVFALIGVVFLVKYIISQNIKRYILKSLKKIENENVPNSKKLLNIDNFIKLYILNKYKERKYTSLYGDKWIEFLQAHLKNKLSSIDIDFLKNTIYLPEKEITQDKVLAFKKLSLMIVSNLK